MYNIWMYFQKNLINQMRETIAYQIKRYKRFIKALKTAWNETHSRGRNWTTKNLTYMKTNKNLSIWKEKGPIKVNLSTSLLTFIYISSYLSKKRLRMTKKQYFESVVSFATIFNFNFCIAVVILPCSPQKVLAHFLVPYLLAVGLF